MNAIWQGLLLGLGGSLHCIGMCGPIALALPTPEGVSRANVVTGRVMYNVGRAITYALMGAVMGLIGQMVRLAGWQAGLSIAAGAAILAWLLIPKRYLLKATSLPLLSGVYVRFKRAWGRLFRQSTPIGLLVFGLLNGFLPCGLVYLALAVAAATGSALEGALVMATFGIGTMATMLPASLAGSLMQHGARQWMRRIVPFAAAVLAVLFIWRGVYPIVAGARASESAGSGPAPVCPYCTGEEMPGK